jgi:hypothetical protein
MAAGRGDPRSRVDGRLSGAKVGASWGTLQPSPQQGLQAAAQVGEAEPLGLLVEVALLGVDDRETAPDGQSAR